MWNGLWRQKAKNRTRWERFLTVGESAGCFPLCGDLWKDGLSGAFPEDDFFAARPAEVWERPTPGVRPTDPEPFFLTTKEKLISRNG